MTLCEEASALPRSDSSNSLEAAAEKKGEGMGVFQRSPFSRGENPLKGRKGPPRGLDRQLAFVWLPKVNKMQAPSRKLGGQCEAPAG